MAHNWVEAHSLKRCMLKKLLAVANKVSNIQGVFEK